MELTIDQALQRGIAAHKKGQLEDAQRLYRAILQVQPNHPDANHNLGVVAVAVGKPFDAIPLFKLALEANPQIEQFWLSYIDALIVGECFDQAKSVLVDAEKLAFSSDKLDARKQLLQGAALKATNTTVKGQTLVEKRKKLAERKKSKRRKAQISSARAELSQDQKNHLIENYSAGRFEEAEALAALLSQQFPKHPLGWKVLGAVFRQTGRLEAALAPTQLAAKLSPRDAEARSNLGVILQELGRLDESEASYRRAIALKPDYAEAHFNLGLTLEKLVRLYDAEASYRQAIALNPDYSEAHYHLGRTLKETGRLHDAVASYSRATALKPDYAEAHYNLGNTLKETGRLEEAEASYRQAIALESHAVEAGAHNNLGITLTELGRLDEAEASYRQAIALKPDYAEAHYNLGNMLKDSGRFDEAEASYEHALAQKPGFAKAHYNLGIMFNETGRLEDAVASYKQAIALKPDFVEAHRSLANTKRFSSQDKQFRKMRELYRDATVSEHDRCQICFALAKAFEDLGDLASAFKFYSEGNALRKKQLGYDKAQDEKLFEQLKVSYTCIAANRLEPEIVVSEPAPIFIVGMPRSGTTLVEQIISSHPQVMGAGELDFVSQFGSPLAVGQAPASEETLKTFREEYLSSLKQISGGKTFVTDKMPQNFRFAGLIAAALPEAKIIHVKRDPAAVCWANYTQYFLSDSLGYCYSLDDILDYHVLYEDLMEYWQLADRIYDLDYELLTEHQEEETRSLIDYLELPWDGGCLSPQENKRAVATASNLQVRQQVYKKSSDQWKRYQPYLNGVLDHFSGSN